MVAVMSGGPTAITGTSRRMAQTAGSSPIWILALASVCTSTTTSTGSSSGQLPSGERPTQGADDPGGGAQDTTSWPRRRSSLTAGPAAPTCDSATRIRNDFRFDLFTAYLLPALSAFVTG